jgi:hypothetical protein
MSRRGLLKLTSTSGLLNGADCRAAEQKARELLSNGDSE